MSFDPPQLPPQGFLLGELGYLDEPLAAIALDISVVTLTEYRKQGVGPAYSIVGRAILYSKANLQKWLDAGGTHASVASGTVPDPTAKTRRQTKPRAAQG